MAKPVRDAILTHYDFGLAGANNELFWDVIWLSMSKMFLIFHEGVLVGGLEHALFFIIFPYIGNNYPQLTFIVFRGVAQPPTRVYSSFFSYFYMFLCIYD